MTPYLNNDRSPTKALGDDDCLCFLRFCLSSFPKEWPPAGLGNLLFVVGVILESRRPGSVVIKQGLDSGTLRAGSLRAACSPLG